MKAREQLSLEKGRDKQEILVTQCSWLRVCSKWRLLRGPKRSCMPQAFTLIWPSPLSVSTCGDWVNWRSPRFYEDGGRVGYQATGKVGDAILVSWDPLLACWSLLQILRTCSCGQGIHSKEPIHNFCSRESVRFGNPTSDARKTSSLGCPRWWVT